MICYDIFGKVGTMIIFRVGAEDVKQFSQEDSPIFSEENLINLAKYSKYLKLMIDGTTSKPFSATITEIPECSNSFKKEIIYSSGMK